MNLAWSRRRLVAGLVTAALVLTGCWGGDDDEDEGSPTTTIDPDDPDQPASTDPPIVTVGGTEVTTSEPASTLGLRLSEGTAYLGTTERLPVVAGDLLTADQVDALFSRLPEWDVPPTDEVEFNRPADSLLPPTVGEIVDSAFPPAVDAAPPADTPPSGPLEVVRFQPEGEVDVAPFLAVTFSEPMVPLATLEALDAAEVPVEVTPSIEGRWRWIGTRTLRFELVPGVLDRLPAATRYEVEVPAGTESANGAVLADAVSWSFTTPTPTVTSMAGVSDSMPTSPVWVATFDQRVDADDVLDAISVTAGDRDVDVRVATTAEVDENEHARRAIDAALDRRAVAFTPAAELPVDTDVEIALGPDVPSAEGPLTSRTVDRYSGRTFGALRIVESQCGWGDCEPGSSFVIRFSNTLDTDGLDADDIAELVTVEPSIPGLRIDVYASTVELRGATRGRTTYEVTFGGDLRDTFGQTLGDDQTVSFDVGPARPALSGLRREFITVDPSAPEPTVSITTVNHDAVRVRAWAVTPDRLRQFRDYVEETWRDEDAEVPEWQIVLDDEVPIDAAADTFTETFIDLSAAFNQAGSQIVVRIDSLLDLSESDDDYWRNRPTVAWVQSTTLGIDAVFDHERLVIATNDLLTGEPVEGIPVELLGDGRVATTDEDGLAELDLGSQGVLGLFANAGDRSALLPASWWDGWRADEQRTDEARWYVFDDRGIYRPGETVRLTGWVRRFAWSEDATLALYEPGTTLSYRAWDAQGAELAEGTVELRPLGGFDLEIELPAGTNLGNAWVEFEVAGAPGWTGHGHAFQVQEFRRPEFEVTARNESPAPYFADQPATVAVNAAYFAGGPLPDAEVDWLVSTRETSYSPPGWDQFRFGVWQPWWWYGGRGDVAFAAEADVAFDECFDCGPSFDTVYEQFSGRTDAGGTHYLQVDFSGDGVDLPNTVTAEATVFDVNRQAWADRTDMLVHPARVYVGIRSDRNFVRQGTPIRVDAVVTDIDGELVSGRDVTVTAGRLDWSYSGGRWSEQLVDETSCDLLSTVTSEPGTMRCEFDTEVGGTYRITAVVIDELGNVNRSEMTQWVSGGQGRPVRNVEQEQVTIVPDREAYEPGDVAELLVQAPFAPASGMVTIIHHGIESTEAFDAEDGSAVIEIPIEDEFVPGFAVQVDIAGSAVRFDDDGNERSDLPPRPAFAVGRIDLSVPPVTRALEVVATPASTSVEPGDDTSVTIEVTDADGEPVAGADVAVVVVDEAVLSLTGYELADPLDVFYQPLWSNVRSEYLRSSLLLTGAERLSGGAGDDAADGDFAVAESEEMADDAAGAPAEAPGAERSSADPIELRTDFDPLALYEPDESTGADGSVTVDVSVPDNLTRYRVMAVAVDGADRFGKGESAITARLPLMVRASAPRFLNYGDRFELPVVLQNQTDDDLEVDVAVQVANLELLGGAGQAVVVPANDRIEVRFPTGTASAGTARVRVVAANGSFADASEFSLPVYTPSTKEAFATYGVIDDGAIAQPLLPPENVIGAFGGLEIGTSSTALQALTDAVLYLHDYRYDSSDGYASRLMAVAALRDVLDAFDADGLPPAAELEARVADDIADLTALQNDDGGWPYWQRGRMSIPWTSLQAAHALVAARYAGYSVPSGSLDRALAYASDIEQHIPSHYSEQVRRTLRAYALYVLGEAGLPDATAAAELYFVADGELEVDALAWIWPSVTEPEIREQIERTIQNAAVETAGAAAFATGYAEDAYVIAQSDRKVDGIVLDALLTQTPDTDLIPKVVNGLLGHQVRGRWNNAHENAFILLALNRYFDTFESVDPDFVARAWLGDDYVAEAEFVGRTTDRVNTAVPMSVLLDLAASDGDATADPTVPLVVAKDGEGRLYYRLGLTYSPNDLRLDARDEGFIVERTYEAVDDPDDVQQTPDGNWLIRAGATVHVRLTMVAESPRAHVALADPLPAGLEPINPALAVSQTVPPPSADDGDISPYWWWRWFGHQNLRDDRAEAFAEYVYGGTYEYSYLARATTPGTFVTPPATAEEIYSPEVFGRTATAIVVVE